MPVWDIINTDENIESVKYTSAAKNTDGTYKIKYLPKEDATFVDERKHAKKIKDQADALLNKSQDELRRENLVNKLKKKGMSQSEAEKLLTKRKERQEQIKQKTEALKKKEYRTLTESFSDYELYLFLEENGYAPTKRNLYILKEGIIEGDIELIDEELTPSKS